MSLQITSLFCEVSLSLTYNKVKYAINNCRDRQKLKQLRHKARDLKINPGLIPPPHTRRDNPSLVRLIAFGYKLLILHGLRLSRDNSDRKYILGKARRVEK
ncbi:uncharacterized protein FTOL_13766 [Fusarium torulosum]|uniref:Uncharacterized protein n=1 Tax=Fusarium torulosum TaxID=33205 RepID=A0AAE8MMZ2_9HYPO|nr:uncharacterized protein FTOL_13766 [Fusarium torulosum]